jgi:hypothetical protein
MEILAYIYTRAHNNVGPRVGFAYNPQTSTVVRGGFGNTPHFSQPNTTLQTAGFGTIGSTVISPPQRELQFGLKLSF